MENKNDTNVPKLSYDITNPMVLVVCISKYRGSIPNLDGSLLDFETLLDLFKNTMGADVIHNVKDDKDLSLYVDTEMFERYLDQTRLKLTDKKNNYDAFIFAFSGHGYKGGIMTSDGSTHELKDISKRFSAKRVSSLKDRPKIFLIDACRHRKGKLPFDARYRNRSSTLSQIKGNYHARGGQLKFNFYHPYVNVLQIYGNTIEYGVFDANNAKKNLISLFAKHLTQYVNNSNDNSIKTSFGKLLLAMKKELHIVSGGLQAVEINDTVMYDLFISAKKQDINNNKICDEKNDEKNDEIKDDKENQDIMSLKQPLVLLLCVSKYDKKSGFSDLSGVEKDMQMLHDLFETTCKYHVICNHVTKNIFGQKKGFYLDKDSLNKMLQKTKDELENNNNNNTSNNNGKSNYDGLIVVFSGHGYQDGIITSDGEKHDLTRLKQFFSAKNVPCLKDRGKIFIIDACRHEYEKLPDKDDNGRDSRYHDDEQVKGKSQNNIFEYKWYHPFVNVLEIYGNTPGYSVTSNKKNGSKMIMLFSKRIKEYITKDYDNNEKIRTIGEIFLPMKHEMHKISDGKQVIEINDTLLYNLHLQFEHEHKKSELDNSNHKYQVTKYSYQEFKSNRENDQQLDRDKRGDKEVIKILMLGGPMSGKDMFFKQLKCIHGKGFSQKDKQDYQAQIANQIIEQMQRLIIRGRELIEDFGDEYSHLELKSSEARDSAAFIEGLKRDSPINQEVALHIDNLWNEEGIRNTFALRAKLSIPDSCEHFFDDIKRIASVAYVPSEEDVLLIRKRTTGIIEEYFTIGLKKFHIFDVDGQRNERKKWIHCFENVTSVVFVASLSVYDQSLPEDKSVNAMDETLHIFGEVCNLAIFDRTPLILLLNEKDIFEKKITQVPLNLCFKDYTGDNEYEQGIIMFVCLLCCHVAILFVAAFLAFLVFFVFLFFSPRLHQETIP